MPISQPPPKESDRFDDWMFQLWKSVYSSGSAGTFTTISASGVFTSTLAIGTAPFAITSTTVVPNLNVSQLLGGTWAAPGTIGSGTPNTGAFTTLEANSFVPNSATVPANGVFLPASNETGISASSGERARFAAAAVTLGGTSSAPAMKITPVASQAVWMVTTAAVSGGNPRIEASANNLIIGSGNALATTATTGYPMIPSCAGVPTGVPVGQAAGKIALVWDSTNKNLYAYDPATGWALA